MRNAAIKRMGSAPAVVMEAAPRMIGAISAAEAMVGASGRAEKTMGRPWRKRLSASDTISIMRS